MIYLWLTLMITFAIVAWVTNIFGLPGNWMILAVAILWYFVGPVSHAVHLFSVVVLLVAAGVAELLELVASIAGTKKYGGSKTGATLSLICSIIGGIFGAVLIPIPVVGWIVGPILFACVGALVGAAIGEKMVGKPMKESLKIGQAAFIGRFIGTVSKVGIGSAMVVLLVIALFADQL